MSRLFRRGSTKVIWRNSNLIDTISRDIVQMGDPLLRETVKLVLYEDSRYVDWYLKAFPKGDVGYLTIDYVNWPQLYEYECRVETAPEPLLGVILNNEAARFQLRLRVQHARLIDRLHQPV